jgi:hypothetical protein
MNTNNTISNEATTTTKKKRKRWTQNTAWYLFLPIMEQAVKDKIISKVITRDYFKKLLNYICKAAGKKREDIGIIAGVRAELYFGGTWTSISFDAIDELAEKGTKGREHISIEYMKDIYLYQEGRRLE